MPPTATMPGSSPLARGTRILWPRLGNRARLIPARAGNTPQDAPPHPTPSAHPRSRGEHQHQPTPTAPPAGSSPLARGTPRRAAVARPMTRLIPARAGNTLCGFRRLLGSPAHPRSRGEHALIRFASYCALGSSPLARGTPGEFTGSALAHRLIPARAGNTFKHQCY